MNFSKVIIDDYILYNVDTMYAIDFPVGPVHAAPPASDVYIRKILLIFILNYSRIVYARCQYC